MRDWTARLPNDWKDFLRTPSDANSSCNVDTERAFLILVAMITEPRRWIVCIAVTVTICLGLSTIAAGQAVRFTCDPDYGPNIFLACPGDCDENGVVTIDELITLVNIVLTDQGSVSCSSLYGTPDIGSILESVNRALYDCVPVVDYRLTESSSLAIYDSNVVLVRKDNLSGNFRAVFRDHEPETFVLQVTELNLSASAITIEPETTARTGCMIILVDFHPAIVLNLQVSIDGSVVRLSGYTSAPECCDPPHVLENLQLCGREGAPVLCDDILVRGEPGYVLTINATAATP